MEALNEALIEKTYLFCYKRISDVEEARDLAQDILCAALKEMRRGVRIRSFYSWYWQLARNRCADWFAHRRNPALPIEAAEGVAAAESSALDVIISDEDRTRLRFALSRLAASQREIMIRFYLKEESVAKIARELGIPAGTVKRRLYDARTSLKERYEKMNTIGKTAYAPAEVNQFWGYDCMIPQGAMSLKITQQIAVLCREKPQDLNSLSDEMGVAPVFLEEMVNMMLQQKLLKEKGKGKYLTDFCAFPNSVYELAGGKKNRIFCEKGYAKRILAAVEAQREKLLAQEFYGKELDPDTLKWLAVYAAGHWMGATGCECFLKKYGDKYPDEPERKFRTTIRYILPEPEEEKEQDDWQYLGVAWSNLHQSFRTVDYGTVHFVNAFDMDPFPHGYNPDGRDAWVNGANVSLMLKLARDPAAELSETEQEEAAVFLKRGLLTRQKEGLRVMLPVFSQKTLAALSETVKQAVETIAADFAEETGETVEKLLLPYVRKDLMSNFLHWDMKVLLQCISDLYYMAFHDENYLKWPENPECSPKGLYLMTDE